jgi:gliding motility-associated-like protein
MSSIKKIKKITSLLTNTGILLLSTFLSSPTIFHAQTPVCLGNDTLVCQGQTVNISHCPSSGSSTGIVLNNPTNLSLTDDAWSQLIPMGFSFSFYGNVYTSCLIGSNGIVSFDASKAGGYCSYILDGTPLPNTVTPEAPNAAMGCYQDLNPINTNSGPIQYQTIGVAPNRKFVVLYKSVTMYSCTSSCAYISMVFYETSNVIEYFIGFKGECLAWNNGCAVQGIENSSGTVAHITPGRNNSVWSTVNDGYRWTPNSNILTSSYTISPIPYVMVSSSGNELVWKNTNGLTFPYNNGQLIVNQVPPGTTGYFLASTACGNVIGSISDTTWITRTSTTLNTSTTQSFCNSPTGTATANPLTGKSPFTYNWPTLNQTTQSVSNLVPGNYTVVQTDANGCKASSIAKVLNTPSQFDGDSTEVSCYLGNDGTATAFMTPVGTATTYQWNDSLNQTTQTATGLKAGTYQCMISSNNGCSGTVNITVTTIPSVITSIQSLTDVTCHAKNDGVIQVSSLYGTPPYSYTWSGSSSQTDIAYDLYAGNQSITTIDSKGCTTIVDTILSEPPALSISYLTPDTTICSESSILLTGIGSGGSSPYTYTWYSNAVKLDTGQSIMVNPLDSGTLYIFEVSEACGSPNARDSVIISFPAPIDILIVPDTNRACAPFNFEFYNNSTNSYDIASMIYTFSNNKDFQVGSFDTVSATFYEPNYYDLHLFVTSNLDCIYEETFEKIIQVLKPPKAKISAKNNPIYINNPRAEFISSSIDCIEWEWTIPDADPSTGKENSIETTLPSIEGEYPVFLKVKSEEGCYDSTDFMLTVDGDLLFYAPNVFTPNNDEFNPTWKFHVFGIDIYDFNVAIYNRWGMQLWETNNYQSEWDGTYKGELVPNGTYNYVVRLKEKGKIEPQILRGTINVMK